MASLTDDNEAGGNLDKRNIWLIGVGHTSMIHTRGQEQTHRKSGKEINVILC